MGAYLSQPNITKGSSDGGGSNLSYGISAMQGWRVSMEVGVNESILAVNSEVKSCASIPPDGVVWILDDLCFLPVCAESWSHS